MFDYRDVRSYAIFQARNFMVVSSCMHACTYVCICCCLACVVSVSLQTFRHRVFLYAVFASCVNASIDQARIAIVLAMRHTVFFPDVENTWMCKEVLDGREHLAENKEISIPQ